MVLLLSYVYNMHPDTKSARLISVVVARASFFNWTAGFALLIKYIHFARLLFEFKRPLRSELIAEKVQPGECSCLRCV